MKRISNSRINTYNKCPKQYWFAYAVADDIEVEEEDQFLEIKDLGRLVHHGLEHTLIGGVDRGRDAVFEEYGDGNYIASVNDAVRMVSTYAHLLGIGEEGGILPYYHNDEPFTEFKFEIDLYEYAGIPAVFTGIIDAVVWMDGKLTLIDWKTRGRYFARPSEVELDQQLYLYAWAAKDIYGIPIEAVCQIQLKKQLPSTPRLTSKGDLDRRLGKTTLQHFMRKLPDEVDYEDVEEFVDSKIVDLEEFVQIDYIPFYRRFEFVNNAFNVIRKMIEDTTYTATYNSYACRFCMYKEACLAIGSEDIRT